MWQREDEGKKKRREAERLYLHSKQDNDQKVGGWSPTWRDLGGAERDGERNRWRGGGWTGDEERRHSRGAVGGEEAEPLYY